MIEFLITLGTLMGIAVVAATGLNITMGYGGVFSTAQAVFYGVGAYTSFLMAPLVGGDVLLCMAVGLIVATLVSIVLGATSLRIAGEYFMVASLAFQIVMSTIFDNWTSVTGGSDGVGGISVPHVFGFAIDTSRGQLTLVWVIAVVVLGATLLLRRSPQGRMLLGIRDDEIAVQALGKSPTAAKMTAVCVGAAITSLGGVLYAFQIGFVNSANFNYAVSIQLSAIVVIGGVGTLLGPILGSAVVIAGVPLVSLIDLPQNVIGPLEQFLYGAIIIVIIMVRASSLKSSARVGIARLRERWGREVPVRTEAELEASLSTSGGPTL